MNEVNESDTTMAKANKEKNGGADLQAQAEAKAKAEALLSQGARAVGSRDTDPGAPKRDVPLTGATALKTPDSEVYVDQVEFGPKSMGRITIGLVLMGVIALLLAVPLIHDWLPVLHPGDGEMITVSNIAGAVTAANRPTQATGVTPASTSATPTKRGTAQATTTAATLRPTTQPASVGTAVAVVVATAAEACSQTCVAEPSSNACATCGHLVFGWPAPPQ